MKDIVGRLRSRPLPVVADQHALMYEAAQEIERLQAKWVLASDRLPKEYETVLVATDEGVSAGEIRFPDSECGLSEPWWMVFKDRRNRSIAWAGWVSLNDVTHWMPLPAPPSE